MRFWEYIASQAAALCFAAIGLLLLCLFLFAAGGSALLCLLAALAFLLLTAAALFAGWWLARQRIEKLERIMDQLPEKYLLGEVVEAPQTALEKQYYRILQTVSRSAVGVAEDAARQMEAYQAYVESWIHEIKTPLTACNLILANGGDAQKLRPELKKADNLAESILYYARLRTIEKDVQVGPFSARKLMEDTIQNQMAVLIAAGIRVETQGDFTVYSDPKPVAFMLGQILINCAKYCPNCLVQIEAQENRITVTDNGPGIAPHELPRVTERGFTGSCGKRAGASTGMGLFIVDALCSRLGIKLQIESELGRYTRVCFVFPQLTKV